MTQVEGGGVPAGTHLNGIYEVEDRIAIGGMGEVYAGRVIQTGDKVAIKMILPEHADNEVILDLFRREASTLHNLYHEAIVRYYVFSVDPVLNRPYLSMEFAAGPSIGERLRDGGPLTEAEMEVMRRRVAGGLHAAHRLGIIHRDISPDNIILVDGDVERAKIIDFGIAKSTTNEGTLIGSGFAGKLNYVSPEQLGLEGGEVTGKSDIYSLGLVFAEAVIGHPLPMGGSQVEVIEKRRSVPDLAQVPEWIRPLIEAMLQPDPADRPDDMHAVADWTPAGAAESAAAGTRPPHPRERRRGDAAGKGREKKRGAGLWIGLGGVGIAAAAAAGFVIYSGGMDDLLGSRPSSETVADAGLLAPAPQAGLSPDSDDGSAGPGAVEIAAPSAELMPTAPDDAAASRSETGSAPALPLADKDPAPDSDEPTIAIAAPGGLAAPALNGTSDGLSTGGAGAMPVTGQAAGSRLSAQGGTAGDVPTLPAAEQDPTADAAEPVISNAVPGLSAPAVVTGDAGVADPDSDTFSLPQTGGSQPQQPAIAAPGEGVTIASVSPPENAPPIVETALSGPIAGSQGRPVNARLGSFSDEAGPNALDLKVVGDVPTGLSIRLAEGGIAQLHGSPAEYGEYEIRIATVDPHGLESQPIVINLTIAPPAENKPVRDYILGYQGGDCFLSRPLELGPQLARIEVFASEDKVQPVIDFDAAFKRDMGFEANIGMRPISAEQCPLIHALDQVGPAAIDNSLAIDLAGDELASGDRLTGKIRGGKDARLFLYDHLGGLTDISPYVETKGGETGFSVPITASGPQILVAARPSDGAQLDDAAGLEALLGAAQQGRAALALGFFVMQ